MAKNQITTLHTVHHNYFMVTSDWKKSHHTQDIPWYCKVIAFDEGRTLPNLLGCLLSRRFPVHASKSWPVFFRSMVHLFGAMLNDVTMSLRKAFCFMLRCLEGFKLYCCLVGKLFCYVVKKFRRCNLSKPEESVCYFWTLYINQNVFCFERFAMFIRTDPLWSQIKSAK